MTSSKAQTILILAANPKGTTPLRLDREVRDIQEGLQRSHHRDVFTLVQRWAVRPRDIQRALLEVNPQIIHFSGHGDGEKGLAFEDDAGNVKLINGAALAGLFELFVDQVECVVLNACYSEVQATAIVRHIPYVIGMNSAIGDPAALEFSVGFYDALGAGRSIEFAYKLGCSAIQMAGITESLTPVLKQKSSPVLTASENSNASTVLSSNSSQLQTEQETKTSPSHRTHQQQQRIQQEMDSLQQVYELLSEKLQRLRTDLVIQAGSTVSFQLEKEIERTEAERTGVEQRLRELDR